MELCLGVLCLPADITVAHVISLPGYVFGLCAESSTVNA